MHIGISSVNRRPTVEIWNDRSKEVVTYFSVATDSAVVDRVEASPSTPGPTITVFVPLIAGVDVAIRCVRNHGAAIREQVRQRRRWQSH